MAIATVTSAQLLRPEFQRPHRFPYGRASLLGSPAKLGHCRIAYYQGRNLLARAPVQMLTSPGISGPFFSGAPMAGIAVGAGSGYGSVYLYDPLTTNSMSFLLAFHSAAGAARVIVQTADAYFKVSTYGNGDDINLYLGKDAAWAAYGTQWKDRPTLLAGHREGDVGTAWLSGISPYSTNAPYFNTPIEVTTGVLGGNDVQPGAGLIELPNNSDATNVILAFYLWSPAVPIERMRYLVREHHRLVTAA